MRSVFTPPVLLVLLLPLSAWAGFDPEEGVFTDATLGVRLQVPEGWTATTQTGYPDLLLLLQTPGRKACMVLGRGYLAKGKSLAQYVDDNAVGIRALGMTIFRNQRSNAPGRNVFELAAGVPGGVEVRQFYVAQDTRVFTVSLAGPSLEVHRLQVDLQQMLAGLTLQ